MLFGFGKKKQPYKWVDYIEVAGQRIAVYISVESRKSVRASIVSGGVNIRIPLHLSEQEHQKYIIKLKQWATDKLSNKLKTKSLVNLYDGAVVLLADTPYLIHIKRADRKSLKGHTHGHDIYLTIPCNASNDDIERIFYKVVEKIMLDWLNTALPEINRDTVNQKYSLVVVKTLTSKWGSCSNRGLLTFNSRLMVYPKWVIRYVIVHELCHLIEMNHSKRFWNLVALHCPEYKQAKAILKGRL